MNRPLGTVAVLATGLVLAACGADSPDGAQPSADPADATGMSVVATTTVLGDVVARVAECGGGTATTLMPIGADPHDFSPSSDEIARMVNADLVVANGLNLEEGLTDALSSAAADGAVVLEVAQMVDPLPFGTAGSPGHNDEGEDEHGDEADHAGEETDDHGEEADDHGSLDPHFWHDAARMAAAAELVGAELADRTGDDGYDVCGSQVADELRQTDEQVRSILSAVPDDRRVMVTDHEAFGYFAEAYDFEIAGVVIPGGATLAEPSSQELAALVEVIIDEGVPAVFANTEAPSTLTDAVAAEAGSEVTVVPLYVGSLGEPGSGAETYDAMMTTNAQRIADALAPA
jgi:zinc/manganese transport system substrate-binding protein